MFGLFKKRKNAVPACRATAMRQAEIAAESMELLRTAVNPRTFFGRCDDIAAAELRLAGTSRFRDDTEIQTALQIEFIDRAAAKNVSLLQERMARYENRLTPAAMAHYLLTLHR